MTGKSCGDQESEIRILGTGRYVGVFRRFQHDRAGSAELLHFEYWHLRQIKFNCQYSLSFREKNG